MDMIELEYGNICISNLTLCTKKISKKNYILNY